MSDNMGFSECLTECVGGEACPFGGLVERFPLENDQFDGDFELSLNADDVFWACFGGDLRGFCCEGAEHVAEGGVCGRVPQRTEGLCGGAGGERAQHIDRPIWWARGWRLGGISRGRLWLCGVGLGVGLWSSRWRRWW